MRFGGVQCPAFFIFGVIMGTVTDKKNYAAYSVTVNGLSVEYRYCGKWMNGGSSLHDHFDFLSHNISDSKYLSHFVHSAAVDSVNGHQQYAELFCKAVLKDVPPQLDMFA
jgi:hypothetical protein